MSSKRVLTAVFMLMVLLASACNLQAGGTAPAAAPALTTQPAGTTSTGNLPLTEAEVPRVSVETAQAARASGEAVIVDVRSADAYSSSHIAGAINIPLAEIEANPAALDIDKDRWIITYCT